MSSPVYLVANGDLRLSANRSVLARSAGGGRSGDRRRSAGSGAMFAADTLSTRRKDTDSSTARNTACRCSATSLPTRRSWSSKRSGSTAIIFFTGSITHKGPILTVANWSGQWPGLVGMLNLNGSLTKAGVNTARSGARISPTTSFSNGLQRWLKGETVAARHRHVHASGQR